MPLRRSSRSGSTSSWPCSTPGRGPCSSSSAPVWSAWSTAAGIRILLARGLGRLQLLAAKWVALAIAGLGLLVAFAAAAAVALGSAALAWHGSLHELTTLPAQIFHQLWVSCLIALLSMAVSILLGTAAAVVGRSLAFGIGAALAFFPADNFGTIVLGLIASLTHQRVWANATAYLLGPDLNAVAGKLITDHPVRPAFAVPLAQVDATKVLAVIGVGGRAPAPAGGADDAARRARVNAAAGAVRTRRARPAAPATRWRRRA